MLEATSDARVVVTARTTAGEAHESVVRVGPLPVPSSRAPLEGPAVELFLRRIRAAGGQAVDLAAQAHEVRRLLSATGGLPLLIEQVAVQSALVGLSNAMSTVSLEQAVDSAHDLLDEASATALRRIGLLDFQVGLGVLARVLDVPGPRGCRAGRQPRAPQPARGRPAGPLRHALPHPRPRPGARATRRRRRRRRRPAGLGRRRTPPSTTTTAPPTPSGCATCPRCGTRCSPRAPTRRRAPTATRWPTASSPPSTPPCAPARRSRSSRGRSPAATARPASAPRSPAGPASPPPRCAAPTRDCGCSTAPTSTPRRHRDPRSSSPRPPRSGPRCTSTPVTWPAPRPRPGAP